MTNAFARLTTNQRLAVLALLLGAIALFSNTRMRATLDPRELAMAVDRGSERVQPRELADRILKGQADYRLIDLRDASAFAVYHIPGAENVPLAALGDGSLAPGETLVLYSEDGSRAAEAWVLLKAQGFRAVYVLDRGLDGWKQDVLFPVLKENAVNPAEQQANERLRQVSAHFGGTPRTGTQAAAAGVAAPVTSAAMPKVELPAAPGGAKPAPRKKKEGC